MRFDSEGGAAAAFEHLLELGHRRIGHLAADFDAPTFHLREDARRRVLSGAGLDPDALPRAVTQITIDDARDAAGPLLDEQPTAVFCDDDIVAAGLYLAARERGLRIPRDLSVVGFDDMDFARVLDPAADHRGARRRAAGRHRLRAARGAHGRRAPAAADRAPGRARGARLDRATAMSDAARAAFEAHAEDYEAERRARAGANLPGWPRFPRLDPGRFGESFAPARRWLPSLGDAVQCSAVSNRARQGAGAAAS